MNPRGTNDGTFTAHHEQLPPNTARIAGAHALTNARSIRHYDHN